MMLVYGTHVPVMLVETVSVSALLWQHTLQHAVVKEFAYCGGAQPFAVSDSKESDYILYIHKYIQYILYLHTYILTTYKTCFQYLLFDIFKNYTCL